ncbi:prepilin-type N-terminal cleavage/methylation domain-containing protein [Candidatus Atribacteria bacterium MT.SAG.1]|nr:prepilin-type N-terminal cleavage/methylation domain-containing protein [Candidatus Atribacteria bacterium MT.SAG.1]
MRSKAFTLIEILVAITVLTIGIMACYAAITKVVSLTYLSSFRFVASRLAQEGMELVSNTRDTNWLNQEVDWDNGLTDCIAGCEIDYNDSTFSAYQNRYLKIGLNGFYNYENGNDSRFKRKITITHVSSDELKIKVEVIWSRLGLSLETLEVEEHLYNWR